MNATVLTRLIKSSAPITPSALRALDGLVERYPYFQASRMLLAKSKQALRQADAQHSIRVAMLYATDRNRFKKFLQAAPSATVPSASSATSAPNSHGVRSFSPEFTPSNVPPIPSAPSLDLPNHMSDEVRERLIREINQQASELKYNMRSYEDSVRDFEERHGKKKL